MWLCGAGTMVVLVLFAAQVVLLRNWDFDVWIGTPARAGGPGALLALIALVTAAISLGIPSARRAFAGTGAEPPVPGSGFESPASLRAAASRFAFGGVSSFGALAGLVVLLPDGDGIPAAGFVILGGAGLVDPRRKQFLQPERRHTHQGRESRSAPGPRPVDDPAAAEGYPVP